MTNYKTSQDAKTKPCRCGRGKVYTGEINRKYNSRDIEGREACEECALDAIYARFNKERQEVE